MNYILKMLIAALLVNGLSGQVCVSGYNYPPRLWPSGTPLAWPKTGVSAAPAYVGYVQYVIWETPTAVHDGIETAFRNWNAAASENASTVYFQEALIIPISPFQCSPSPCTAPVYPWVSFERIPDSQLPPGKAAIGTPGWEDYGYGYYRLYSDEVQYSDLITDEHYAAYMAAHELGHTFALDDCNQCDTNGTVMTSGTILLNAHVSGLTGPSYCDNQAVLVDDVALLWNRKPSFELAQFLQIQPPGTMGGRGTGGFVMSHARAFEVGVSTGDVAQWDSVPPEARQKVRVQE